jgi:hypothetical protein
LINHHQVFQVLLSSPCLPAKVSTTISLTHNRTSQRLDKMAEEAMRSLGDKFFYFNEDGDHVPHQRSFNPVREEPDPYDERTQWYNAYFKNLYGTAPTTAAATAPTTSTSTTAPQQAPTTSTSTTAPVSGGGGSSGQATIGLGLVMNGKTFPKIEAGRERWYTQRPGQSNSYSRYSDLVRSDKAKGITPQPKASEAELKAARRQQTFG